MQAARRLISLLTLVLVASLVPAIAGRLLWMSATDRDLYHHGQVMQASDFERWSDFDGVNGFERFQRQSNSQLVRGVNDDRPPVVP